MSAWHAASDLNLDPFPHCQFDREAEAASDNVCRMLVVSNSGHAKASSRPPCQALISTHINTGLSNQCHRIRLIMEHAPMETTERQRSSKLGWLAAKCSSLVPASLCFDSFRPPMSENGVEVEIARDQI